MIEDSLLEYNIDRIKLLRRCQKCLLPETFPFIEYDDLGICNYCYNYKLKNIPKSTEELFDIVKPYRHKKSNDCIVPFSGGRDSCYGLHLVVNELKMKPITYTYDWGMISDVGRRNISRMCNKLNVENILVTADISQKRRNITTNLKAWLKSPHLGMISILTAGDKHFFKYVETVKKQTGISLNLWSVNPLEITHFKAGFLGIKPDFEEIGVYSYGIYKQLRYQYLRFQVMLENLSYFNSSLWDTLSGEYYRSLTKKRDYYHIYDYWHWMNKKSKIHLILITGNEQQIQILHGELVIQLRLFIIIFIILLLVLLSMIHLEAIKFVKEHLIEKKVYNLLQKRIDLVILP